MKFFTNYLEIFDDKLCDFVDGWYRRLLWDTYDDVTTYVNSSTFIATAAFMFLIPFSELYYFNTTYYFYIAIVALIVDVILFYVIGVTFHMESDYPLLKIYPDIRGIPATMTRIWSISFYILLLFVPEVFETIIRIIFPGTGDFVLTQDFFLGKIPADSPLLADKREILFRIFWGLAHIILICIFAVGFKQYWRRHAALREAKAESASDDSLSYDLIFKKSLSAGFGAIADSIIKYPVFWGVPTFLFTVMGDGTQFIKSPYLMYTSLASFDAIRLLSYNFAYFETALWWFFFLSILIYLGDFGSFDNFYARVKEWSKEPLKSENWSKLLVVIFVLFFLPLFWIITDNSSFNSYIALVALENNLTIIWLGSFWACFFFLASCVVFFYKENEENFILLIFLTSCSIALFFLGLVLNFHNNLLEDAERGLFYIFDFFEYYELGSHELFVFGYDYTSLLLCLMTSVVFALVMYFSLFSRLRYKIYYFACLIYLLIFILLSFLSMNLFTFYLCFESTIIPVGLLILQWGSSDKRYFAARQYVFYSIASGLPLLAGLGYLYNVFGTLDYLFILNNMFVLTYNEQLYLWASFFLVFAVKVPLFPFHSWLLNAHVEASTGVSIILAAVLLKIGTFGMIRYSLGLFHLISAEYAHSVRFLALVGIMYASLCAITEIDLKRLVAFTSIAHMNFAVLGLFMFDESAFYGAVITMYAHSAISAALFFIVGVLYSRIHIREITVYGGLVQLVPVLSSFLFFFAIANAGFPCSLSFIGELFLFISFFKKLSVSFIFFLCTSTVLLLYANLRFFIHVCFGTINVNYISPAISDFGHIELCVCLILFLNAFVLFFGFDHFFYPLFEDFLARYFI